jgi:hypothetical protein
MMRKQMHVPFPISNRRHQVQELSERVDVVPRKWYLAERLIAMDVPDRVGQLVVDFPIHSLQRQELGNPRTMEGLRREVIEVGCVDVIFAEASGPMRRLEFLLLGMEDGQEFGITDEMHLILLVDYPHIVTIGRPVVGSTKRLQHVFRNVVAKLPQLHRLVVFDEEQLRRLAGELRVGHGDVVRARDSPTPKSDLR